jgi:sulfur carrier protein ThiS
MLNISIGRFPGRRITVAIAPNSSITEVLEMADIVLETSEEIRLNGEVVSAATTLSVDAEIRLLKKVKGAAISVSVVNAGQVIDLELEDATTVEEALTMAGITDSTVQVTVDGEAVSRDYELTDLDRLAVSQAETAQIKVGVARFPGMVRAATLTSGATVADALQALGLTLDAQEEVRVGGAVADTSTVLKNSDRVSILKKVKGA